MKALLVITLFNISNALGCEIILNKTIFIDDITNSNRWVDLSTNCGQEKIDTFSKTIRYFNGSIPKKVVNDKLRSKKITISSQENKIIIKRISSEIKKLFPGKETRKVKVNNKLSNLALEKLKVTKSEISYESKQGKREKIPYDIEIKESIYHTNKNTTPFDVINIMQNITLRNKWVPQHNQGIYFKSKKKLEKFLRFYTLNGFLRKDTPLSENHFKKRNLLQFGKPVKIIFNQKNLSIKTTGTPQGNGGINDNVPIRLANNKIILGKIINKDTVSADL